jgi:threonine/homoserine/homoserine lactone efflux protein
VAALRRRAAYLVWLGIRQWRGAAVALEDVDPQAVPGRAQFWRGFLVSATNPKTLLFYAAFFPQFIDPASPPGPQRALLSATFLALATVLDGGYVLLAGRLRRLLRGERRARAAQPRHRLAADRRRPRPRPRAPPLSASAPG